MKLIVKHGLWSEKLDALRKTSDTFCYWLTLWWKANDPELQIRCVKLTSIDSSCIISSPNPMFDHLLESSQWDDSNKWSNIGLSEEIGILKMKIRTLSGALDIQVTIYELWLVSYELLNSYAKVIIMVVHWLGNLRVTTCKLRKSLAYFYCINKLHWVTIVANNQ